MTATAPQATRSLWDVEDIATMPAVRDMFVGPAATADVQEFARRYHYTGIGNNANWRWGLWYGATLLGVVSYNLPTRSVCASVFGTEHLDHVWHMGRLALAEDAPRNSESRLIGGSLRAIAIGHPDVWAVVTYAATSAGHIGYVYQATNAIYTGIGGRPSFCTDQDGQRRGTHLDGHFVSAARAAQLGWTLHRDGAKHRYVYILGNKSQRRQRLALLQLPRLPYPKTLIAGAA
jgi:adenine modification enzyme